MRVFLNRMWTLAKVLPGRRLRQRYLRRRPRRMRVRLELMTPLTSIVAPVAQTTVLLVMVPGRRTMRAVRLAMLAVPRATRVVRTAMLAVRAVLVTLATVTLMRRTMLAVLRATPVVRTVLVMPLTVRVGRTVPDGLMRLVMPRMVRPMLMAVPVVPMVPGRRTAMLMRRTMLAVPRMAQAMMPRAMPVIRVTVLVMLVMVRVMMDAALVMARMVVTGMLFAGGLTVFRMMRRVLHTSPCTLLNSWRGMPRPMSSFKLISRRGLMPVIPFSILMELR